MAATASHQLMTGWAVVDVFKVRDQLIEDYREFTRSFVDFHDKAIRQRVDERMAGGYQWPDPSLSLNPSFASGGTVSDLIAWGLLQSAARDTFRLPSETRAPPASAPEGGHPPLPAARELDALYFHLYGIPRDDVDYIMETFPIVKRKDIAAHGIYRTKDAILQIYDAMAKAKDAGTPYQPLLDPAPGHGPRHPAR